MTVRDQVLRREAVEEQLNDGYGNPRSAGCSGSRDHLVGLVQVVEPVAIDEAVLQPGARDAAAAAFEHDGAPPAARLGVGQRRRRARARRAPRPLRPSPAPTTATAAARCRRARSRTIGQQSQPAMIAARRSSWLSHSARRIACRVRHTPIDGDDAVEPGERFDGRRVPGSAPPTTGCHQRRARKFDDGPTLTYLQLTGRPAALERPQHRPDVLLGAAVAAGAPEGAVDEGQHASGAVHRCGRRRTREPMRCRLQPAAAGIERREIGERQDAGFRPDQAQSASPRERADDVVDQAVALGRPRLPTESRASAARRARRSCGTRSAHLLLVQVQLGEPPQRIFTVREAAAQRSLIDAQVAQTLIQALAGRAAVSSPAPLR